MSPAGWLRLLRLRREKEQRDYQQQSAIHSSLGVLYARRGGINCQPPKVLATRRSHADEAVRPTIVERACQQKEQFLESRGSVTAALVLQGLLSRDCEDVPHGPRTADAMRSGRPQKTMAYPTGYSGPPKVMKTRPARLQPSVPLPQTVKHSQAKGLLYKSYDL